MANVGVSASVILAIHVGWLAACKPGTQPAVSSAPPASVSVTAPAPVASDAANDGVRDATRNAPELSIAAIAIVDWPIVWPAQRDTLMLAYRRAHSDPKATDLTIVPRVIVLHYTAGGSAKATKSYFDNLTIEPSRKQLYAAGKVNVSSHFLIDLDGTIYRLMPETKMARHCIGLNHNAIGVENVGDEARIKLTDAQVDANIALVRYLTATYPTITHMLGHFEVMKFSKDPLFVELDPTFRNDKPDPGPRFLGLVRAGLHDLHLRGLPIDAPAVSR